jgi:transposase-like protein
VHQKGTPWSPEEIKAMRKEVLEDGTTIKQLAERNGVTHQRIQQLIGPLYGQSHRNRVDAKLNNVIELIRLRKSDEEIAACLGISLGSTKMLRLRAGIHRSNRLYKWTRAKVIAKALEWHERYGYTPSACDWNPSFLKNHGDLERSERFYESGAPHLNTVRRLFGNWSVMINETGLLPASKSRRFHKGMPNRN